VAERAALAQNIANLEDKAWTRSGEKTEDLTRDEFVKRYKELGGDNGDISDWKGDEMYRARITRVAADLEENPNKDFDEFGNVQIGSDANAAQKRLVEDYRAQQLLGRNGGGESRAVQGGNELVNAANELRSAADALRNASQPSITGVSGPSTAPGG
jgi:hypothetical protein